MCARKTETGLDFSFRQTLDSHTFNVERRSPVVRSNYAHETGFFGQFFPCIFMLSRHINFFVHIFPCEVRAMMIFIILLFALFSFRILVFCFPLLIFSAFFCLEFIVFCLLLRVRLLFSFTIC